MARQTRTARNYLLCPAVARFTVDLVRNPGGIVDNPYQGHKPLGQAWDLGYQYAPDTDPAAPDFSDWSLDSNIIVSVQQVWREGALALAGRVDAAGGKSKTRLTV